MQQKEAYFQWGGEISGLGTGHRLAGVERVMKGLRDLQQRFAAYLLGAEDSIVPASVVGDDKADARERMDLYAGAYRARLVGSLGVDYPGLWSMLGDEQFYALCLDYIRQHPSRHTSIRWFGDRLPAFLGKTPPYDAYPQVAEMAVFEWTQGLVFDDADVTAIGIGELAGLPPGDWPGHAACVCSCTAVPRPVMEYSPAVVRH